ncbi:MAG: NUDIX domain-containing protein [Lachnospiraceae bacterium]|nr:NUDIX domain-containing protein [Lachnospiraceae bacterium]
MKSPMTTLCYIEQGDRYLMMHRIRKEHDVNHDKWIGIGGHFEEGESPEECLIREVREETGLSLASYRFRGLVTFVSDCWDTEYMCLYTAEVKRRTAGKMLVKDMHTAQDVVWNEKHGSEEENPHGIAEDETPNIENLPDCREGVLEWVPKAEVTKLNLWEGDKIFLKLLAENAPFFSLKLRYEGDVLREASLDGQDLELLDVCDSQGNLTGRVSARCVAHAAGVPHRTVHIWVVRRLPDGKWQVLLQRRSERKSSFPGCLDVSSAGHVSAGDTYGESARRELQEELGIRAEPEKLEYAGIFDSGDILAKFDGETFHDREISAVYIYRQEIDADALQLQPEEVDSVLWMDYEECLAKILSGDSGFCVNIRGIRLVGEYLMHLDTEEL